MTKFFNDELNGFLCFVLYINIVLCSLRFISSFFSGDFAWEEGNELYLLISMCEFIFTLVPIIGILKLNKYAAIVFFGFLFLEDIMVEVAPFYFDDNASFQITSRLVIFIALFFLKKKGRSAWNTLFIQKHGD